MEPDGRLLALSRYLYYCLLITTIQVTDISSLASGQQTPDLVRVGPPVLGVNALGSSASSDEQQQRLVVPAPSNGQNLLNGKLNPLLRPPQGTSSANQKLHNSQQAKKGCRVDPSSPGYLPGSTHQQDQLIELANGFTQAQVSPYARPSYYTLRLKLDPSKRKFSGQLMISLDVSYDPSQQVASSESTSSSATIHPSSGPFSEASAETSSQQGHRYLSLNVASNIHVSRAFYVFGSGGGVQVPASGQARDATRELITLDFYPNLISAGQGLLLLSYTGYVNETDSIGLFLHHSQRAGNRQSFGTQDQQNILPSTLVDTTAGLATHMQPSFARCLLPSWDEPSVRAKFKLILVLPFRGYQTISNMPVQRKSISLSCSGEPLQEVEFQQSPLMPIYLLNLVVGHFDYLEAYTANKCRVRVYVYSNSTAAAAAAAASTSRGSAAAVDLSSSQVVASPNTRRQGAQLALEVALRSMELLEQLTGVSYPLSKIDLIALREFNSGGMENWGAAVFHENYLLYESQQQQQTAGSTEIQLNGGRSRPKGKMIPLVVAHELAHQWFGNLVGPQSWNYLWLSEGFAQMLMYELADQLYPANQYARIFLEDSRQAALHDDQLLTGSHALEQQRSDLLSSLDQLSLFDQITYNKGALIVRMLQQILGREAFYGGLQHYLLSNSYKSVQSRQLWDALEQHSRLPDKMLSSLMHSWLTYEGFPLLTVHAYEEPTRPDKLMVHLTQERFSLLNLTALGTAHLSSSAGSSSSSPPSSSSGPTGPFVGAPQKSTPQNAHSQLKQHEDPAAPIWWIPVGVASEFAPDPQQAELKLETTLGIPSRAFLMRERAVLLSLSKASTGSWLKLNHNGTGYFRVDYSTGPVEGRGSLKQIDLLARMVAAIRDRSMGTFDRFNLVDDLFALVRAARKPTTFYLRYLLEAYPSETEPMVLRSIFDSLRKLRALLTNADRKLVDLLDGWARNYLRLLSEANQLSGASARPEEPSGAGQETLDLLETARFHFNDSAATPSAQELFTRHFRWPRQAPLPANQNSIDRELRGAAYSRVLNEASANEPDYPASFMQEEQAIEDDTFSLLLKFYLASESQAERSAIAYALGSLESSNLPNKQARLLNMTLYESFFRSQDAHTLLESMARTGSGRALIWDTLSANPSALERRQMLGTMLKSLSHSLIERLGPTSGAQGENNDDDNNNNNNSSNPIERELRALYTRYQTEHGRSISQAIELLLVNTNWFKRDLSSLTDYLEQFRSSQEHQPPL